MLSASTGSSLDLCSSLLFKEMTTEFCPVTPPHFKSLGRLFALSFLCCPTSLLSLPLLFFFVFFFVRQAAQRYASRRRPELISIPLFLVCLAPILIPAPRPRFSPHTRMFPSLQHTTGAHSRTCFVQRGSTTRRRWSPSSRLKRPS